MILFNPTKDNKCFKAKPVMSNRKLFERYGLSLGKVGHPDNTDPTHFTDPVNSTSHHLDSLRKEMNSYLTDINDFVRSQNEKESGSKGPDPAEVE